MKNLINKWNAVYRRKYLEPFKALADYSVPVEPTEENLAYLDDRCSLVRQQALDRLGQFADIDPVRIKIIKRLKDKQSTIRESAAQILGKYIREDDDILFLLKDALVDESPYVTHTVLTILEPYINKDNKEEIIGKCLKNKYILFDTLKIILKHLIEDPEKRRLVENTIKEEMMTTRRRFFGVDYFPSPPLIESELISLI
ncbi:MAG: HEAT repeat domain-containing protein [Candidatus Pacebacteria bacterium]|nr:HEAT repeat domain-containing protein [Candidatus Paceibacterota bacterium]